MRYLRFIPYFLLGAALGWIVSGFALGMVKVEYIGPPSKDLYCHVKGSHEFECINMLMFLKALREVSSETPSSTEPVPL